MFWGKKKVGVILVLISLISCFFTNVREQAILLAEAWNICFIIKVFE